MKDSRRHIVCMMKTPPSQCLCMDLFVFGVPMDTRL